MNNLRELLREADPLRHEPDGLAARRDFHRRAVLAAASSSRESRDAGRRPRLAVIATVALMLSAALLLGGLLWSVFNSNLQAAIRFEVRLAEDSPAPGLQKAKVSGSDRLVYLQEGAVVTNSDIATSRIVAEPGRSRYDIRIEFNPAGAEKIRRATQNHLGKPLAILLNGQVVMAPVVRSPIGGSAVITGNYTKSQAERIVRGIGIE